MSRFFERGEEPDLEYWFEDEQAGLKFQLTNETFMANIHEILTPELSIVETDDAIFDRVCVLDPRDDEWFAFWRAEHSENWEKLEFMVRRCGTLLVRQVVLDLVKQQFDAYFLADIFTEKSFPLSWDEEAA